MELHDTPSGESQMREASGAAGSEVLLLERNEGLRASLSELLQTTGLIVTASGDAEAALDWVQQKFFSVAVLDMDTPQEMAGLEVLRRLREASPATVAVLLTASKTFDRAVEAYQAGARRIFAKQPEDVEALVDTVVQLCTMAVGIHQRPDLVKETIDFMESFLRKLMEASRRAMQAEETVSAGGTSRRDLAECLVLVVDDNPKTAPGLQQALGTDGSFRCIASATGGEALDFAGQNRFHLALVKDVLPDLPGSMVAKSLYDLRTGAYVLLFSDPGTQPGYLSLVEESKVTTLLPRLTEGRQLVSQIQRLREMYVAKQRERRYLDAFRTDYIDFLKNYVQLRRKLSALLPDSTP